MKLGKNQLALLLIIEQATRQVAGLDEPIGRVFVWEDSIQYYDLTGQLTSFYMMTRDLKSLESLVSRGLIRQSQPGYHEIYTITDAGRRTLDDLRARAKGERS